MPRPRDLMAAFASCARAAASPREHGPDEVHVACLVAELLDPTVIEARVEFDLDALAARHPRQVPPWSFLAGEGFAGNADDYESLRNSNLAWVLESRRGIPITLGVVLMRVAREAGHQAVGINFPGHFLVQVDDVLVDPFLLRPARRDQLLERLPAEARRDSAALFAQASPLAVGLRMLNNVKAAFARQGAWDRLLQVLDAQLALAPGYAALYLERGDVWAQLGMAGQARAAYQQALELAEELPAEDATALIRAVEQRLEQIGDAGDVVH